MGLNAPLTLAVKASSSIAVMRCVNQGCTLTCRQGRLRMHPHPCGSEGEGDGRAVWRGHGDRRGAVAAGASVGLGARAEAGRGGLSAATKWSCKEFVLPGKLWASRNNRIIFSML